jgi:deoxyribodipyrimidine photo-lyase
LPADTVVIGVFLADFHRAWPWSERRWHFVGSRMAELAPRRWHGAGAAIGDALAGARSVRSIAEPHLLPWLPRWTACKTVPELFPPVDRRCDSFSQWWTRTSRGLRTAADLLAVKEVPAW